MMTLQEAISHAREVAKDRNETANLTPTEYEDYINSCRECAAEHDQLADWLTELKERRETMEHIKKYYILVEKSPRDNPNELIIRKAFGESEATE